jgi:hypothetical protein
MPDPTPMPLPTFAVELLNCRALTTMPSLHDCNNGNKYLPWPSF